jgi:hypothetical protein
MDVLGDLIARDRRSDAPALRHAPSGRAYDYRRFCTTAWKVGNFLRNEGVRGGMSVAVAADPVPEAVLTLYGAGSLGAGVAFGAGAADAKALVAPADAVEEMAAGPSTRRIAYGDEPADPSVAYFERDVWSENPTQPPDRVAPGDPLLRTDDGTITHGAALAAARAVVEARGLGAGSVVVVRAPLAHPGTVVAGLVAPVLAGGVVLLAGDDADATADLAVTTGDGHEPRVHPDEVL